MIRSAVQGFYAEVRRNDLLGALFDAAVAPAAWPGHLAKMCDFWSATLLRTGRYVGRSLPPHLVIPGVAEVHFRRWLALFEATVRAYCPPEVASLLMDRALRTTHSIHPIAREGLS
ncbi:group III truncated hemoglobin [Stella sp.]|jgi:hemoglobin|uniref:group III truncated hemoglobin n=1 Tax=Stella sp. TaxID=2912054 RepID=UPI0035B15CA4